jgi:hypothetical protein
MSPTGGRLLASVLPGAAGVFIEFVVTFYLNTMTDFDPDVPVKRQVLDVLVGKHIHVRHVTSDLSQAKGYLTWDATQPEHTLIRAIQFGLAMVRTDCTDEWVVAGSGVFALIRTMDDFVELDRPEIACGLTYAGNIRNMRVYLLPWPAMPAIEILIGHGDEFARCVCTDFPVGFGGERPPEMIDPNANGESRRTGLQCIRRRL